MIRSVISIPTHTSNKVFHLSISVWESAWDPVLEHVLFVSQKPIGDTKENTAENLRNESSKSQRKTSYSSLSQLQSLLFDCRPSFCFTISCPYLKYFTSLCLNSDFLFERDEWFWIMRLFTALIDMMADIKLNSTERSHPSILSTLCSSYDHYLDIVVSYFVLIIHGICIASLAQVPGTSLYSAVRWCDQKVFNVVLTIMIESDSV